MGQGIFVTGTDTGVGKTVVTVVLGTLLQHRGVDVGVVKPVQCGGNDAAFLRKSLKLTEPLSEINPLYSPAPYSPHVAFPKAGVKLVEQRIRKVLKGQLSEHDVVLVEGAGGLLVPLSHTRTYADALEDWTVEFGLRAVVVARLGLGTINHTLLTLRELERRRVPVAGVVFCETRRQKRGVAERTNPPTVARLGGVPVLGVVPFLAAFTPAEVVRRCRSLDLAPLLQFSATKRASLGEKIPQNRREVSAGGKLGGGSLAPKISPARRRQLAQWDHDYVWHPFTQQKDWVSEEPLVVDRAEGSYLVDTHGRRYIDGVSSLWVNVHGHRNPKIDAAVEQQLAKVAHSTFLGLSNTPAVELAKKLVDVAPTGLAKVFYSDNGSTSVEVAVKLAYQYWQNTGRSTKTKIAHLSNSYHGDTLGSVSVGGIDLFHKVYRNLIFPTVQVEFPDFYRAPAGKVYPAYAWECVAKLEALLSAEHTKLAALVVEPLVQGAAGMLVWIPGILKEIERICQKYDVLLIADEVATGFGRTGKMFACQHEDVHPDFLCVAKGLTGGYLPLAATLTTQRVYDGFVFDYKDQKTFFHGHTYTANPLGCAAALANLELFQKERTLSKLQPKIKHLSQRLKSFYNLPPVGDVRQCGLMVGIELVKDRATKEPFPWEERVGVQVCQKVRERGVILRPLGNVIVLMPPLSISRGELDDLLDVTYWAIEQMFASANP